MIIKSKEGTIFVLTTEQIVMSNLIKEMIENCTQTNEIYLDSVNTKSIQKIIEFMVHETDKCTDKLPDNIILIKHDAAYCMNVNKWYSDFLQLNKDFNIHDLKNLTNAANYLDINNLLELCCAKIASILKGKSKEEMRSLINLENDFSTTEEKEINKEHGWVHAIESIE